jgi:hypothetical protein
VLLDAVQTAEAQAVAERTLHTRIEHVDSALLAVVNDVVFNFSSMVSSDISTLWFMGTRREKACRTFHRSRRESLQGGLTVL